LGVWPIIMGITMWVQMQLNPQQADPVQQKIFNWMPVMFTFLLGRFASGLVIYWAWNNLLSLSQQYIIMRRQGAEIHLWKNLGVDKLMARFGSSGTSGRGSGGAARTPQRPGPLSPQPAAATADAGEAPVAAASDDAMIQTGDGKAGKAAPAKGDMTREQALKTLGLGPGATATQIEAAYRARARQKHGGLNGSEKLNRARDVLRSSIEGT
ncbi:MAG TPA: YidC/Oxa1 family membrane protein insertase, partial [Hyphomicrobiaceae bacterium]|nr:YidC/Oxa1 family membrane protein insertase [Hyphomicrobiaceae bacterium]